jgi:hypothetical protein
MTIDLTDPNEPKLNMSQAAKYLAPSRCGRPPHKSRVIRYITVGRIAPNGVRVYLDALRQGSQWVTTARSLQHFCEALTPKPGQATHVSRATAASKAAERARRELDKLGF